MAYLYQPYSTIAISSSTNVVNSIIEKEELYGTTYNKADLARLLSIDEGLEIEQQWLTFLSGKASSPHFFTQKAHFHNPFFLLSIKPYCTIDNNGKWFLDTTAWHKALKTALAWIHSIYSCIQEKLTLCLEETSIKEKGNNQNHLLINEWIQKKAISLGIKDLYPFLLNANKGQETKAILAFTKHFLNETAYMLWKENLRLGSKRGGAKLEKWQIENYKIKYTKVSSTLSAEPLNFSSNALGFSSVVSLGISLDVTAPNLPLQTSIACICKDLNDTPIACGFHTYLSFSEDEKESVFQSLTNLQEDGFALMPIEKTPNASPITPPINSKEQDFFPPQVVIHRPKELECDVVRFQNNKEKWVAFVGLLDGYPYEIFTGLQDDDEGIVLPKTVLKGKIIKKSTPNAPSRYDFQFENKRGYKTTVEGLSEKFNPEYWNYAKLISGVLRYRMPLINVIKLVSSLQLKDPSINTWTNGVERALKKYLTNGTFAPAQLCPNCNKEKLYYIDGNLVCQHCNCSKPL